MDVEKGKARGEYMIEQNRGEDEKKERGRAGRTYTVPTAKMARQRR